MTSMNTDFTAVGQGDPLLFRHGEELSYSLGGTFVATLELIKSVDGGQTWEVLKRLTAASTGTIVIENSAAGTALVKWRCTARTSGTAGASMYRGQSQSQLDAISAQIKSLIPTTGRRARNVCLLGDSRAYLCNSTVNIPGNKYIYDSSFLGWAQAISGTDINLLGNDGVSLETTAQILKRVPAVIAKQPDVCFVIGSFNDLSASVPFGEIIGNLGQIFRTLSDAGIYVVSLSNTAYTGVGGTIRAGISAVDWWAYEYFLNNPSRGRFVDFMTPTADKTTGDWINGGSSSPDGTSQDGIHQSNYGAYLEGVVLAPVMTGLFSPIRLANTPLDYVTNAPSSKQLNPNPLFNGTAGTVVAAHGLTGPLASNYTAARYGGSGSTNMLGGTLYGGSLVGVLSQSGNAQIFTVTSSADGDKLRLSSADMTSLCAIGEFIRSAIKMTFASGAAIRRVNIITSVNGFNAYGTWGNNSANTSFDIPLNGTITPQTYPVQKATTGSVISTIEILFSGDAAGTVITLEGWTVTKGAE
jgi:lysophospholipase L1-like esterase